MAKRTKRKISWKKVICGVFVAIIVICCIGGISSCFREDNTKTISSSVFSRGGLDENGEHVVTNKSLVTEESFDCIGLRIVPDFDSHLTYDVYYYDYYDNLIEKKLGLKKTYDEDFPLAKTCRIVIHPEGSDDKDFEIGYFDVRGIAKKLTITVDKEQKYLYDYSINLYNEDTLTSGKSLFDDSNYTFNSVSLYSNPGAKATESFKITDADGEVIYEKYDIYVRFGIPARANLHALLASADGTKVAVFSKDLVNMSVGDWTKITVEIPDDISKIDHLRVSMPNDADCYIFGYND